MRLLTGCREIAATGPKNRREGAPEAPRRCKRGVTTCQCGRIGDSQEATVYFTTLPPTCQGPLGRNSDWQTERMTCLSSGKGPVRFGETPAPGPNRQGGLPDQVSAGASAATTSIDVPYLAPAVSTVRPAPTVIPPGPAVHRRESNTAATFSKSLE